MPTTVWQLVASASCVVGFVAPPARRAWKGATHGLVATALIAIGIVAFLDVDQIASAGSIADMVVFFMINVGHMRLRSETGASLSVRAVGALLLAAAAIPFLLSTWENEPVVVWFTAGSLVLAIMLETSLFKVRHREVPAHGGVVIST